MPGGGGGGGGMEMMGAADRVADGMEQSWITAHVFQLTCLCFS